MSIPRLRHISSSSRSLFSSSLLVVLLLICPSNAAKWNATGTLRQIWVTPVMEYQDLFSSAQLDSFADDVRELFQKFLLQKDSKKHVTVAQNTFSSTPNDKDRLNEDFYNYQITNPINPGTLETIWQAFVYACQKFMKESGMPPVDYQREKASGKEGELEWTKGGIPRRGSMYCWGSVQNRGTHHDTHTHPGSALAGTLYLSVPADGGALYLVDPRGPLPPFQWSYRIQPQKGKLVIFPGTLPHGVHSTPGDEGRVSISCNHPGDWQKFTNSRTVYHESTWSHPMMSRDELKKPKTQPNKKITVKI